MKQTVSTMQGTAYVLAGCIERVKEAASKKVGVINQWLTKWYDEDGEAMTVGRAAAVCAGFVAVVAGILAVPVLVDLIVGLI